MGLLKLTKRKLMKSEKMSEMIVRGGRNEILVDLDGDKQADIGILDTTGEGFADTIALDINGDNQFNLYIMDSNLNGIPDVSYIDELSDGNVKLVSIGESVMTDLQKAAAKVFRILNIGEDEEIPFDELIAALKGVSAAAKEA